jgi:hypothetical protein
MNEFLEPIIANVVGIGGAALVTALVGLVVRLLQRVNIQLDAEKQERVRAIVRKVVLKVEEIAARELRELGKKWTGPEKLAEATSEIIDELKGKKTAGEVQKLVHAELPVLGLGAAVGKPQQTK